MALVKNKKTAIVKVEVICSGEDITQETVTNVILGMETMFNGSGTLSRSDLKALVNNLDRLHVHLSLIGFDYRDVT